MTANAYAPTFTFEAYERHFAEALACGYRAITVRDYFESAFAAGEKVLINRVDVDVKIERLPRLLDICRRLGIRMSVYLRLHAPAYNLLTFSNIAIVRDLVAEGHEIGLHTELADAEGYCGLNGAALLRHELALLRHVSGTEIVGTASHGDMTQYNNLHFWRHHRPEEFGLLYEAYDPRLWDRCRYVSDSEWTRWKSYQDGKLLDGDRRTPGEHARDGMPVLHVLTHPESWYDRYIYE